MSDAPMHFEVRSVPRVGAGIPSQVHGLSWNDMHNTLRAVSNIVGVVSGTITTPYELDLDSG
jgi:hypothetical protein